MTFGQPLNANMLQFQKLTWSKIVTYVTYRPTVTVFLLRTAMQLTNTLFVDTYCLTA